MAARSPLSPVERLMGRIGLFIGELAERTGISARTLRYYESIGLLPRPPRGENRYRLYSRDTIELLGFIRKAQGLGFRLAEIKEIISLRQKGHEPCGHVRALLDQKIADLDQRLADLGELRKTLKKLRGRSEAAGKLNRVKAVVCPHIEGVPLGRGLMG